MPLANSNYARITYNGCVFTGPSLKWDLSFQQIPDDSGATTKWLQHTLHVRGIISDNANSQTESQGGFGTNFQSVRACLQKNGMALKLENTGFDMSVNMTTNGDSVNYQDVNYGPIVNDFKIHPLGSTLVAEFEMKITFFIQACSYYNGQIKEFATTVEYQIDNVTGLTTRRMDGMYSIVVSRQSAIGGSSDKYSANLENKFFDIAPAIPLGFRRTESKRKISKDRSSMSFNFTDVELPNINAYPVGATFIDMKQTTSINSASKGESKVIGAWASTTIRGRAEVSKTANLVRTWEAILAIVRTRIEQGKRDNGVVFLTGVSLTEDIFAGQNIAFSFSWTHRASKGHFPSLLRNSGLFLPPDTSHQQWHNSQRENWHPQGLSKLKLNVEQERITDLCSRFYIANDTYRILPVSRGGGSIASYCPNDTGEYITWDSSIEFQTDDDGVLVDLSLESSDGVVTIEEISSEEGALIASTFRGGDQVPVTSDSSQTKIILSGSSVRVNKFAEVPSIARNKFAELARKTFDGSNQTFDTSTLVRANEGIAHTLLKNLGGCKLFRTIWNIEYLLSLPTGVSGDTVKQLFGLIEKAIIVTESDSQGEKAG